MAVHPGTDEVMHASSSSSNSTKGGVARSFSTASQYAVAASPHGAPHAALPPVTVSAPAVSAAASTHPHMILAGLVSGVSVAGLFNPWDRALYLSVVHTRPFLTRANFSHPYQGFMQVVVYRTLSGGLYFPLFDMAQPITRDAILRTASAVGRQPSRAEQSAMLHFVCGNFAGGTSGILLNALTAIKYASWDARTGFLTTVRHMYTAGGYRPFVKGVAATVVRDTVFGGVFALTKFQLAHSLLAPFVREDERQHGSGEAASGAASSASSQQSSGGMYFRAGTIDFASALMAGLAATAASSPFNYVRNIKYGWPSHADPPSAMSILGELWRDATASGRLCSFLQERLRLGWGTARVAVGMAVGQYIYETTKMRMDDGKPTPVEKTMHKPPLV